MIPEKERDLMFFKKTRAPCVFFDPAGSVGNFVFLCATTRCEAHISDVVLVGPATMGLAPKRFHAWQRAQLSHALLRYLGT